MLLLSRGIVRADSLPLAPRFDELACLLERVALCLDHFPADRKRDFLCLNGLSLGAVAGARCFSLGLFDRGLEHLDLLAHLALRRFVIEATEHRLELSKINGWLLIFGSILFRVLAL